MNKVYRTAFTLSPEVAARLDAEHAKGIPLAKLIAKSLDAYLPKLKRARK